MMNIIQQPSLFDIDYLASLDIKERHQEIFSPINFTKITYLFSKNKAVGAPIKVNYNAALRALITRYIERIPTIKNLVRRLKEDVAFKLSLGFSYSENVPSEATFCRIIKVLSKHCQLLQEVNSTLLKTIDSEFGIFQEDIAIDATAVEAHTKPVKNDKTIKITSTNDQLVLTTEEILSELPQAPQWGIKSNSQGKNNYWFGYKLHLATSTDTQYILSAVTTSANISDVSVAIPLMRQVSALNIKDVHVTMDKGYDAKSIYAEAHTLNLEPIIDMKKAGKHGGEIDDFGAPTCLFEYSYKYDSFDNRYGALKFVLLKSQCANCALRQEGMCQKVIKIKQEKDYRKFAHPARNTLAWKKIYNKRSAVERVNGYLKDCYQLDDTHYSNHESVVVEGLLIQLAYNAKTFANQRISKQKTGKEIAV